MAKRGGSGTLLNDTLKLLAVSIEAQTRALKELEAKLMSVPGYLAGITHYGEFHFDQGEVKFATGGKTYDEKDLAGEKIDLVFQLSSKQLPLDDEETRKVAFGHFTSFLGRRAINFSILKGGSSCCPKQG